MNIRLHYILHHNPITMSAVPVLIELEKLAKQVTHTLEEFQKVSKNMDYYLLECSTTEEKYWMQKLRLIRSRVNILIDEWEMGMQTNQLIDELTDPTKPDNTPETNKQT